MYDIMRSAVIIVVIHVLTTYPSKRMTYLEGVSDGGGHQAISEIPDGR